MSESEAPGEANAASPGQAVLARKYRPQHFDELIGQDALVRTLTNAIRSGRLHHAYLLTGVRGTGKTTTARIIAKALNYAGPDGTGTPTTGRTDDCPLCQAIAESRHPDVLEIDAASHTGVDNIREILDSVRYRPVEARYKIYIIDEVHMLSKGAFNALLKTLEEPPEHVCFIFATTEVRKVPVTVVSRCQRFDLRRVEPDTLKQHYADICTREGIAADDAALALIARAADGSVRDGLSLLDQAIAMADGRIGEAVVQDMLGLADRGRIAELLEAALTGRPADALAALAALYRDGADPAAVVQDLLDLTHQLSRLKVVGRAEAPDALGAAQAERMQKLGDALALASLNRAWQMLLKGLSEVQSAPTPIQAAEMLVIRLAHTADLPTPEAALAQLRGDSPGGLGKTPRLGGGADAASRPSSDTTAPTPGHRGTQAATPADSTPDPGPVGQAVADAATPAAAPQPGDAAPAPADEPEPPAAPETESELTPAPASFAEMVELLADQGVLYGHLVSSVHPVRYEPGRLEFRPARNAPSDLMQQIERALRERTGRRWFVALSDEAGAPTLAEQRHAAEAEARRAAEADPAMQAVLATFPGARITDVRRDDGDRDDTP